EQHHSPGGLRGVEELTPHAAQVRRELCPGQGGGANALDGDGAGGRRGGRRRLLSGPAGRGQGGRGRGARGRSARGRVARRRVVRAGRARGGGVRNERGRGRAGRGRAVRRRGVESGPVRDEGRRGRAGGGRGGGDRVSGGRRQGVARCIEERRRHSPFQGLLPHDDPRRAGSGGGQLGRRTNADLARIGE